jgi:hypothetical protein
MRANTAMRPKNKMLECLLLRRTVQYTRNLPATVSKTLWAKLRGRNLQRSMVSASDDREEITAEFDAFGAADSFALD